MARVTKAMLQDSHKVLEHDIMRLVAENNALRLEVKLLKQYNPALQVITASMATNSVLRELIKSGRLR